MTSTSMSFGVGPGGGDEVSPTDLALREEPGLEEADDLAVDSGWGLVELAGQVADPHWRLVGAHVDPCEQLALKPGGKIASRGGADFLISWRLSPRRREGQVES